MKKQIKRVYLPEDELPHKGRAIEWWYFNGFLKGEENEYAFMTCLFKADKDKVNLKLIKIPQKTIYFSHSSFYNLKTKEVIREILPFVLLSQDSFSREKLFVNYFYPLKKSFINYEISRLNSSLRLKNSFFDIELKENKKPLLEGGNGFLELGKKTTYYYSYTNLSAEGFIANEKVKGSVWHDRQWSNKGFMRDSWLWFSFQLPDNTEIVCFNYEGRKLAFLLNKNNKQFRYLPEFTSLNKKWRSPKTKLEYNLNWRIKLANLTIETMPYIEDCEMNFGLINYWEGPVKIKINGEESKKARGFMEYLPRAKELSIRDTLIEKIDFMNIYKTKN